MIDRACTKEDGVSKSFASKPLKPLEQVILLPAPCTSKPCWDCCRGLVNAVQGSVLQQACLWPKQMRQYSVTSLLSSCLVRELAAAMVACKMLPFGLSPVHEPKSLHFLAICPHLLRCKPPNGNSSASSCAARVSLLLLTPSHSLPCSACKLSPAC